MSFDRDWTEYNWLEFDENGQRLEEANFIYENELGEESVETYPQPFNYPTADDPIEALSKKYFADLAFWINAERFALESKYV